MDNNQLNNSAKKNVDLGTNLNSIISALIEYKNQDNKILIQTNYTEYTNKIEEAINKTEEIKGINSKFKTLQSNYIASYKKQLLKANKQMNEALNNTIWDKLVIVFFGETNAGKSTIIESFRILFEDKQRKNGNDGLIIGDGSSDFTKVYEKYDLKVNNKLFTLIDVPGIEGSEEDFKEEIKDALNQAHCIFYVQGHNKQPDEATAQKIKKFLNNWVKVYSIYNVRGGVSNYDEKEDRISLNTPSVDKTGHIIEKRFKEIIGDKNYKGNITIQALLAICSIANFSTERNDLIKTQKKLNTLFNNDKVKLFKFSQFSELIKLVDLLSGSFTEEIYQANKNKIISIAKKAQIDIENETNQRNKELDSLKTNLSVFEKRLKEIILTTQKNIRHRVHDNLDKFYSELQESILNLHKKKEKIKKKEATKNKENLINSFEKNNEKVIKDELDTLNDRINKNRKSLDEVGGFKLDITLVIDLKNIDISKSLYKGLAAKDIFDGKLFNIVGKNIESVGKVYLGERSNQSKFDKANLVFQGLRLALNLFEKFFPEEGINNEAQENLNREINKSKKESLPLIDKYTGQINQKLIEQENNIASEINIELRNINKIESILPNFKSEINQLINSIE